jgi:hypothetical protein
MCFSRPSPASIWPASSTTQFAPPELVAAELGWEVVKRGEFRATRVPWPEVMKTLTSAPLCWAGGGSLECMTARLPCGGSLGRPCYLDDQISAARCVAARRARPGVARGCPRRSASCGALRRAGPVHRSAAATRVPRPPGHCVSCPGRWRLRDCCEPGPGDYLLLLAAYIRIPPAVLPTTAATTARPPPPPSPLTLAPPARATCPPAAPPSGSAAAAPRHPPSAPPAAAPPAPQPAGPAH